MKITDFSVERYFARYEFTAKYMLSSSDCDGFAMRDVLAMASPEELGQWDNLRLGYTETVGSESLRIAIRQHYRTIGMDEIVVSSPGEANFALMNVLLEAGDHVVCMAPMYQSLYQVAKDLGCAVSFWSPEIAGGKWYYDPDDLKKLITARTKLIIINFPHNPTGYSPGIGEFTAIMDIARREGIMVFSDEMYRLLHHDQRETLPSACDVYENAISLWGTAKTFGLAGLRLGWLTSRNTEVLRRVERFKDYLSICNNAPGEVLATIALNNADRFLKPNLDKIRSNLLLFEAFVSRHADRFALLKPNSGSTAFVQLMMSEPAMTFAERLVRDTGIMLLPSEMFDYGTSHARIGFGRENMKMVLEALDGYLVG
ncbi:MAG: aminotransferase class I/II-fold pyridoxal phosphate-dependent enzyme [Bacteroidota bacterium]